MKQPEHIRWSLTALFPLFALTACVGEGFGGASDYQVYDAGVSLRHQAGPPPIWEMDFREGDARVWVFMEGEPTLTPDGQAVLRLDAGELMRVRERNATGLRELELWVNSDGQLARDYRRDGVVAEYDEAAAAWFSHVLYVISRTTAIGARDRAEHILWEGGPAAVVAELPRLSNDMARRAYIQFLLDLPELSAADCSALAETGSSSLNSDSYRAELLSALAQRHPADRELGESLIRALARFGASTPKRELVERYLSARTLSQGELQSCAAATVSIASESERSAALLGLLGQPELEQASLLAVIEAATTLSSSTTKMEVLLAILKREMVDPSTLSRVAQVATTVPSESARSSVLSQLARDARGTDDTCSNLIQSALTLTSSNARSEVCEALLQRQPLPSPKVLCELAVCILGTPSEDSRSRLLASYFRLVPEDEAVLGKGIEVGTSLQSSGAATLAYEALLDRPSLSRSTALLLSDALRKVASDDLRAHLLARLNSRLLQ